MIRVEGSRSRVVGSGDSGSPGHHGDAGEGPITGQPGRKEREAGVHRV
jgi:hypothetical protein